MRMFTEGSVVKRTHYISEDSGPHQIDHLGHLVDVDHPFVLQLLGQRGEGAEGSGRHGSVPAHQTLHSWLQKVDGCGRARRDPGVKSSTAAAGNHPYCQDQTRVCFLFWSFGSSELWENLEGTTTEEDEGAQKQKSSAGIADAKQITAVSLHSLIYVNKRIKNREWKKL